MEINRLEHLQMIKIIPGYHFKLQLCQALSCVLSQLCCVSFNLSCKANRVTSEIPDVDRLWRGLARLVRLTVEPASPRGV